MDFLLIILSILLFLLLGWTAYSFVLFLRLEKKLDLYENWIIQIRERIKQSYDTMKQIDIRGSFEADDEVGRVFKSMNQLIHDLNELVSDTTTE